MCLHSVTSPDQPQTWPQTFTSVLCHQTWSHSFLCVFFAWPDATLRPVLFCCYCYFVCCDRLTACASRDLVACLPDCLAGPFPVFPVCHPSGRRSCHLGSSRPSLGLPFFTPHTNTLIICVSHHPRVLPLLRDTYRSVGCQSHDGLYCTRNPCQPLPQPRPQTRSKDGFPK